MVGKLPGVRMEVKLEDPRPVGAVVDEREDLHHPRAPRARQRIGFPDLLDAFAPLGRGDTAGLVFGDFDDLDGPHCCGMGLFGGAFVAPAAHLVRVPAVVANKSVKALDFIFAVAYVRLEVA